MSTNKTVCPVTRAQFANNAKALAVHIGDNLLSAGVRAGANEFSTGSMGYYANGKITVVVDGVPVTCQVGLTITVVGSKELSKTPATLPLAS